MIGIEKGALNSAPVGYGSNTFNESITVNKNDLIQLYIHVNIIGAYPAYGAFSASIGATSFTYGIVNM